MDQEKVLRQKIISLAAPLVLGNILQQLYNTVDSMIIGRFLGDSAFAAVGVSGSIINLFIFVLSGCCTGVSIILAQMYGGRDEAAFRQAFFTAVLSGLCFSTVLSVGGLVFLNPIFCFMNTPAELLGYSRAYLQVILLGVPITFLYNLLSAVLRSIGNTRAALAFLAVSVAANTVLDCVLVLQLDCGVSGAAWATVSAQCLSVILCFLYMRRTMSRLIFGPQDMRLTKTLLKKTVSFSLISALQQSSLHIGTLLVMGAVNSLGTLSIAAYTTATRIASYLNTFGSAGSSASSVLIAQSYGAKDDEVVRRTFKTSMYLHLLTGVVLSAILYFAAVPASQIFIRDPVPKLIQLSSIYLKLIAAVYTLNFAGCAFNGFFRGIGRVSIPTIGSTLHICIRVLLTELLIARLDIIAVALATGAGWIIVVLFHCFCYFKVVPRYPVK